MLLLSTLFCCHASYAAKLKLEGVDDKTIAQNIALLIQDSDILKQSSLDAFWRKQIRDTVSKAVEPYGYYQSATESELVNDNLVVAVHLGNPLKITSLNRELLGEGRADPSFKTRYDNYPQHVGDRLLQPKYSQFKTEIFNYALSHGYFDFAWQLSSIDIVKQNQTASILLIAQSGPQYYFGDIRIKGDNKSLALLQRLAPFSKGDPYSAKQLTEYNRILNESGYYERVTARPIVREAQALQVPIEITLTHRPRDNFDVGIGASSDIGPRVLFNWERPWLNQKGHALSVNAFISEREQQASSQYRLPLRNTSSDYATVELSYAFLDDADQGTDSESFSLSANRFWQQPLSNWQYSASLNFINENFAQGNAAPLTTNLLLPGFGATYLNAKGELGKRTGLKLITQLQFANTNALSDIDLLKTFIDTHWIHSFQRHRVYLRGQLGAIETNDFAAVPSSLRFFTGGDQTVRGFEFQTVSSGNFVVNATDPQQIDFLPTGGQLLATASIEYAYSVSENWRAAVFVDAGTAANSFSDGLAKSIGVGAHWLTLVGPVRFYLAFGQNDITADNTIRLHFILGPEL